MHSLRKRVSHQDLSLSVLTSRQKSIRKAADEISLRCKYISTVTIGLGPTIYTYVTQCSNSFRKHQSSPLNHGGTPVRSLTAGICATHVDHRLPHTRSRTGCCTPVTCTDSSHRHTSIHKLDSTYRHVITTFRLLIGRLAACGLLE
jgi:hypothetical protein